MKKNGKGDMPANAEVPVGGAGRKFVGVNSSFFL
jgi:hypothetical protein